MTSSDSCLMDEAVRSKCVISEVDLLILQRLSFHDDYASRVAKAAGKSRMSVVARIAHLMRLGLVEQDEQFKVRGKRVWFRITDKGKTISEMLGEQKK